MYCNFIKDDKMKTKYVENCDIFSNSHKKGFNIEPVYDVNSKYNVLKVKQIKIFLIMEYLQKAFIVIVYQ